MSGNYMVGESGQLYEIEKGKTQVSLLRDVHEISSTAKRCLALTSFGYLYELSK